MAKVNLSEADAKLIREYRERKTIEGNLTADEEAFLAASKTRQFTHDDLKPENWAKLSDEQKAAARKQVWDALYPGETL